MSTANGIERPRRRRVRDRALQRAGLPPVPDLRQIWVPVGDLVRSYHLAPMPPAASTSGPRPLVIALHGAGGDGPGMAALTGLATRGPSAGFVTVFPDGLNRGWNDGRTDARVRSRVGVDDVAFVGALIRQLATGSLETAGVVDPRQVFACGISNGAFLTDHLARVTGLTGIGLAAIGLVAGTAPAIGHRSNPTPANPTPVTIISGTADPLVPYAGGAIGFRRRGRNHGRGPGRGTAVGAEALAAEWASINGCAPTPTWRQVPVSTGDLPAWQASWTSAAGDGPPVELIRIDGGGHTWPGGLPYLPERLIGPTARLDATGLLLDRWSRLTPR
jgi:polyhydroxybutyrate depolymerase